MDKSLQERLVGAAVLVALGVWLIPWILDGSAVEESAPPDQAAIKLPVLDSGPRAPVRRETIELDASRTAGLKALQDAPSAPPAGDSSQIARDGSATEAATVQVAASTSEEPDAADAPAPQTTAASAEVPADSASVDTTGAAPVASSSELPARAANGDARVSQAAADVDEPAAAAPSTADILAASPVAGWMVQLGSFSDAGNAQRQASRINTYGHNARIYEFAAGGGRKMFRVRLGPVDSRERAEATASSLAAHGFVAQLVAPE